MSVKLGRLVASGRPVEVNRFAGPAGVGLMIQFTAETGYVQVQLAELLRMLLNPRPAPELDPWVLLEDVLVELRKEFPTGKVTADLGRILDARKVAPPTT
jgi:hypothetical protein